MVGEVRVELTWVSPADFKSAASAIPPLAQKGAVNVLGLERILSPSAAADQPFRHSPGCARKAMRLTYYNIPDVPGQREGGMRVVKGWQSLNR